MSKTKDAIIEDLRAALPFFRLAISTAKESGKAVKMGILAVNPDGSGDIEAMFDCDEFFDDLAVLVDLPAETEEDVMQYAAARFMAKHGLTLSE